MENITFPSIIKSLHGIYGNHTKAAEALKLTPRTYRDNRGEGRFKRPQTRELAIRLINEHSEPQPMAEHKQPEV